jgi:hypothetical protein
MRKVDLGCLIFKYDVIRDALEEFVKNVTAYATWGIFFLSAIWTLAGI